MITHRTAQNTGSLISNTNDIRRYELKYTISEEVASGIREYITNFFSPDPYVPPGEKEYIVNTLYFDTPDFTFYYDSKFHKLTRYKLRARYYSDRPEDAVWTEIKYRNSSMIWKTRRSVSLDQWPGLFRPGPAPERAPILKKRLDSFEDLVHYHGARPVLHVRYHREPYVSQLERYGRITFDRQLTCRLTDGLADVSHACDDMLFFDDPFTSRNHESPVILEIKVETMVPFWAIEIIRKFELVQRGFSKYCYGLDQQKEWTTQSRVSIFT